MRILNLLLFIPLAGCFLSDHQLRKDNGFTRDKAFKCNELTKSNNKDLSNLYLIEDCLQKNGVKAKFLFGVIEFDDFGQLRSQKQFTDVMKAVENKVKDNKVVFSLFIHGWKHNASEGSSNLHDFRKFIINSGINGPCSSLYQATKTDECDAVGIYIAWRGDPTGLTEYTRHGTKIDTMKGFFKSFSINNRKAAAKRVSSIRSSQVILDLIRTVNKADEFRINSTLNKALSQGLEIPIRTYDFSNLPCYAYDSILSEDYSKPRHLSLNSGASNIEKILSKLNEGCSYKHLIGHSFGARFLENALAQSLVGQINTSLQLDLDKDLRRVVYDHTSYHSQLANLKHNLMLLSNDKKNLQDEKIALDKIIANLQSMIDSKEQSINALEADSKFADFKRKATTNYIKLNELEIVEAINKIINELNKDIYKTCLYEEINDQKTLFSIEHPEPVSSYSISQLNRYYHLSKKNLEKFDKFNNKNEPFFGTSICLENSGVTALLKTKINSITLLNYIENQIKHINDWFKYSQSLDDLNIQAQKELTEIQSRKNEKELLVNQIENNILMKTIILGAKENELDVYKSDMLQDFLKVVKIYERTLSPPANLIMLINPATEAISANMLNHSFCQLRSKDQFNLPKIKPWLISISSKADRATKWAFPIFVSTKLALGVTGSKPRSIINSSNYRDDNCNNFVNQYDLLTKTAPFIEELQTHQYDFVEDINVLGCFRNSDTSPLDLKQFWYEVYNSPEFLKMLENQGIEDKQNQLVLDDVYIGSIAQRYFSDKYTCSCSIQSSVLILEDKLFMFKDKNLTNKENGYWKMSVEKDFMKDHNDIFNKQIGGMIYTFMKMGAKYNICDNLGEADDTSISAKNKSDFINYCENNFSEALFEKIYNSIIEEGPPIQFNNQN